MELKKILVGVDGIKFKGNVDIDVPNITMDSREINEGDMFIAVKGAQTDGHKYIAQAIESGAKVILADESELKNFAKDIKDGVTLITVPDTRPVMAKCACNFYDNPSRKFKLIGITGTKGKTTTTYMIKRVLEKQGFKVGLVGTVAIYIGDKKLEDSDRTTPGSIKLQKIFNQMVEEKCDVVVMEVSSQGLKLNRVDGCDFDIGLFTNFSEDHISEHEHPDMQDYFNSKLKLFDMCKVGFVNGDNPETRKVPSLKPDCDIKMYGIDNECDFLARDITITNSYVDFRVRLDGKGERIKTFIPGRFSVYNSLAAICVATKLGCKVENIKAALEEVRVPGRSELVDNGLGLTIMIDYAHSPESLQNILQATKAYTRGRVISVFGCGGDRDSAKRPKMGAISGKIADYTIITSDNPRTEDPAKIVDQIEEGIKTTKGKYEKIVDRTEAIKKAMLMAEKNDIIVLAGKGHETYQEINHEKHDYDERVIIKKLEEEIRKEQH